MMLPGGIDVALSLFFDNSGSHWYSFLALVRFPCTPFPQRAFDSEPLSST